MFYLTIKLVFLEAFKGTSKKGDYTCFRFVDPSSLQVLVGFNLNIKPKKGEFVNCKLDLQNGKLIVIEAQAC